MEVNENSLIFYLNNKNGESEALMYPNKLAVSISVDRGSLYFENAYLFLDKRPLDNVFGERLLDKY